MPGVLAIGYGNPGRLDDGIGPAVAELLGRLHLPDVTVDADYQLTVEDATAIAEHDAVVFIDAAVDGPAPFALRRVQETARPTVGFSSHVVEPPELMALARELFGARSDAYVLAVRGYAFDGFGEELSEGARANVAAAVEFLAAVLRARALAEAAEGKNGNAENIRRGGR